MSIKLHSIIFSPNTALVHAQLNHLDIEHEYIYVDIMSGKHKTPEFMALNPIHQIPTFEDGEISLGESSAIQRYIMKKFPNQEFYPTEGQAGAT